MENVVHVVQTFEVGQMRMIRLTSIGKLSWIQVTSYKYKYKRMYSRNKHV